jgi:PBP1b-binding outer membrane lipoprotein LpoB
MRSTTGRSAIRLATLTLLALLVGGCGEDSASPTAAPASTTTAAPTTTTVPTVER